MPDRKQFITAGRSFLKLSIPLFLFLFAIVLACAVANIQECNRQQRQKALACVRVVHSAIGNAISLLGADLQYLATLQTMNSFQSQGDDDARQKLAQQYAEFVETRDSYARISYLSTSGVVLVRVSSSSPSVKIIPGEKLSDNSQADFFQQTKLLGKGEMYLADSENDGGTAVGEGIVGPLLVAATPVFDSRGRSQGMVLIECRQQHFVRELQDIVAAFSGTVSLVNRWGNEFLRTGDRKAANGTPLENRTVSFALQHPESWGKIAIAGNGQFQERQEIVTFATYYPAETNGAAGAGQPGATNIAVGQGNNFYWKIINQFALSPLSEVNVVFFRQCFMAWAVLALLSALVVAVCQRNRFREKAEEESLFSQALQQSSAAFIIIDRLGDIVSVNRAFCILSGYPEDEVIGRNLHEISGETAEGPMLAMWESLRSGQPWQGEILSRKKDGEKFWEHVSLAPLKDRRGAISHFVVVQEDISEQRRIGVELHRLASFPEENADMIIEINLHGQITYANPACMHRFSAGWDGLDHPLLQGLDSLLLYFDGKMWKDFADEVDIDGVHFERRVKFIEENTLIRIYGSEITSLQEIERSLQWAKQEAVEARRMKSFFLANMGHEIRTPLNAILGYTDLMLTDAENPVDKKRLGTISRAGKNLLALINDVLDFAKIEAGKLEIVHQEFSLRQAMNDLGQIFASHAAEKGIDFRISGNADMPDWVIGDSIRLNQILVNLLSNSFKFTEKGSITLHCSYVDDTAIFTVADTGIGISRQQQKVIFAEFQQGDSATTRKYGGTGLGLSITSRLVSLMNGSISLETDIGKGSVFTVRLPFQKSEAMEKGAAPEQDVPLSGEMLTTALAEAGVKLRVLLAEDDEMNQNLIREMLLNLGLDTVVAANGLEALDRLDEADFDLLILDMQMPVLDGMQTIERIRKNDRWKNLFVLALTGEAMPGDKEKFLRVGCNDYLAKPLELGMFYRKIYLLVAGKYSLTIQGNRGDEQPGQPFAASENFVLSRELCFQIVQAIEVLQNNLKIFNPDQIRSLATTFADFIYVKEIRDLQQELQQIAATFDDEALPQLIRKLETFLPNGYTCQDPE
ncbi:MAG: PAS domain S-box protein [Proteobacteria bacterium]|nr:PAS domain S-box protein [Pseudomonadota bacterium]MBU4294744.1 PAS domain S-box protein [Pseudomonadota bacterium]MCG2746494.1 ATP-binding protein [Desulfobulbaceae bacterium]